jgi:hypothetical protein
MGLLRKRNEANLTEREQASRPTCAYVGGYTSRPDLNVATQEGKIVSTQVIKLPDHVPTECEGQVVATDETFVRMTDTGKICVKAQIECSRVDCPAIEDGFFNRALAESYVTVHMVESGSQFEDSINGPLVSPPQPQ